MRLLRFLPVLFAILSFFTISSCQHDIDIYKPDNNIIGQTLNPVPVQASVTGKVVDENGLDVVGATVLSGNHTTTTDNRGLFRFDNIEIDKYASVVTVNYTGYFKGIRTFSAAEGSSNYVRIKLLPKTLIGTIDAAGGGTVTLPNSSSVTLPANSVIVQSSGAAYTGIINIYAADIDPTQPDISQTIPGSFQALDANDFRGVLKSYSMLAVQLEDQSGTLLQIAAGKTAKLHFTIPASLSSSAPSTIPLWVLNETNGLWRQEGSAVKTGNYYEGDVTHFSFWNCDTFTNAIWLEMGIATDHGTLPNTMVRLTTPLINAPGYAITNSLGYVAGLVPANEPILLEILDNCNEAVHSQNIGPFTVNTNMGTIIVNLPVSNSLQVSGNAVDCSNQPVANGVAYAYWEGQSTATAITNGSFSLDLVRCNQSTEPLEVVVVDYATLQQSIAWEINAPAAGVVNTGSLSACGISTQEFITYNINGGPDMTYIPPVDTLAQYLMGTNNITMFLGSGPGSYLSFNVTNPISIGTGQTFTSIYSTNIENGNTALNTNLNSPVTITEYGNIGEYISGSGTITCVSQSGNTYSVYINFRIRRAF